MKYLLYAVLAGAGCWIVSEIGEITGGGFSAVSLAITLGAFLLLAIGIWGLHRSQPSGKNMLSLSGAVLTSLAFAIFALVSIQLMMSESTTEDAEAPLFMVGALAMVVGVILFGISVIKTKYYPAWTGLGLIVLALISLTVGVLSLPVLIQNISNLILACILIYMGVHALKSQV